MNSFQQITARAQADANRTGEPVAILNLNQFSPLYVMRYPSTEVRASKRLVAIIEPQQQA